VRRHESGVRWEHRDNSTAELEGEIPSRGDSPISTSLRLLHAFRCTLTGMYEAR